MADPKCVVCGKAVEYADERCTVRSDEAPHHKGACCEPMMQLEELSKQVTGDW